MMIAYKNLYIRDIVNVLKSLSPIIIISLARLIILSFIGYQEHVSEYGVHWNFFMTIVVVSIIFTIIDININYSAAFGIFIIIVYQFLLSVFGISDILLLNNHPTQITSITTLIMMNKEGIFSLLGYISLQYIGAQLGNWLMKRRESLSDYWKTLRNLILLDIVLWAITLIISYTIQMPSRRMANLSYVLWVLSSVILIIIPFYFMDLLFKPVHSVFIQSINNNLLIIFLLANLMTGLINISINTLTVGEIYAFIILMGYTFLISLISYILGIYKITIKFW